MLTPIELELPEFPERLWRLARAARCQAPHCLATGIACNVSILVDKKRGARSDKSVISQPSSPPTYHGARRQDHIWSPCGRKCGGSETLSFNLPDAPTQSDTVPYFEAAMETNARYGLQSRIQVEQPRVPFLGRGRRSPCPCTKRRNFDLATASES